jgi:transposase
MIGDPGVFKNGRHFSAFLGLVPTSGNKERLLGIIKRGDKYIRALLIQGAHSVVKCVDSKEDRRSQWIKNLKEQIGTNKTDVALANKNPGIFWALLAKDKAYKKPV